VRRASQSNLADAELIGSPAVQSGTTVPAYLAALRVVAMGNKEQVSINLFERWTTRRHKLTTEFAMDEAVLDHFRQDLRDGKFRDLQGRRYTSLVLQAPTDVRTLHNRAIGSVVVRKLVDSRQYERLKFLSSLSPITRKALTWFHTSATRQTRNRKQQLMTQATRDNGVSGMLTVLSRMGVTGIELITPELVQAMRPEPDDDDPAYRRAARLLHGASTLIRACIRQGLLKSNPLGDCDSSTFADKAQRDFLPPDEMDRVRDLTTVDMDDPQQVRDRLTVLLLVDTALRRNELAAVETQNVRAEAGSYTITLPPEAQKMRGKATAHIGVWYPETTKLLGHYLKKVRPKFGGTRLIVDPKGRDASGGAIYAAVVREGERLKLETYYGHGRPGPHDLRRTFATLNAAPLGLRLTAAELADRMRASFDIVNVHYVLRNPLRSALADSEYRGRLAADPAREAETHIKGLERLGLDQDTLQIVRQRVEKVFRPAEVKPAPEPPADWMAEEVAIELLQSAWGSLPPTRTLREYFLKNTRTSRRGPRGRMHVDGGYVRGLVTEYVPLAGLVKGADVPASVIEHYGALRVGRLVLVRRMDVADLVMAMAGASPATRPDKLAITKTPPTHGREHAA
jgi:integrase